MLKGNSASSGGAVFLESTGIAPCNPQNETVLNAVRMDRFQYSKGSLLLGVVGTNSFLQHGAA
jgi:hypothetical protein